MFYGSPLSVYREEILNVPPTVNGSRLKAYHP